MDDPNALNLPQLYAHLARGGLVRRLLELARDEDLGSAGDRTGAACIPVGARAEARLVFRSGGIVAGLAAGPDLIDVFAPGRDVHLDVKLEDGGRAAANSTIAVLSGPLRDVLAIERTLLNLVGRLSGIATRTAKFVERIGPGMRARLYDTRKTTPGLRLLEKYAVRCGGGHTHRVGLYDAVLIKDNHLAGVAPDQLADFVARAAARARAAAGPGGLQFVQVEVESLAMLERVLGLPGGVVDIVLLDNMPADEMSESVRLRDRLAPRVELEASGGITLETIRKVAESGVDRISVGSLTHGAASIDVALDIDS
ncbi:MAG: carboxylating nicotinate-nucleotide diphosphorylase [Phycisphaerales bacterium]|nr:carboxylating nicotinate-nucleotide diphosphorylase [Phycisphaerales bacterium]